VFSFGIVKLHSDAMQKSKREKCPFILQLVRECSGKAIEPPRPLATTADSDAAFKIFGSSTFRRKCIPSFALRWKEEVTAKSSFAKNCPGRGKKINALDAW